MKRSMGQGVGNNMCDVFEMLVERLSNIEQKLEEIGSLKSKMEKLEAYIESRKQDDNYSVRGSNISGMLHGGLPVRINKYYESEEMLLEGLPAYKDKQRTLMIIDNNGEVFMRLEEKDIRENSELFQEIVSCLTSDPCVFKKNEKGKALINAIKEKQLKGGYMKTYTYKTLGLDREDYKHKCVLTELANLYIQSKLPYVKNVSMTEIIVDLRELYIHNQMKKGACQEHVLEEELRKEVKIEEVMEVMKEVMKLMKIEECNHGSEIDLYTFPAYAEDLLVAIQEQDWHKVKDELQRMGRNSSVSRMMEEQMKCTQNQPGDYFDSYRICNSLWRARELFGSI